MSEIKITTEKVREAYKKGNDCVKDTLQNLFGEEKNKIIERELAEYERIKNKYNLN